MGLSLRITERGRTGVESGIVVDVGATILARERSPAEADRCCDEAQDGERGDVGDGEVDVDVTSRKAGLLDGERDKERRILKGEALSP